ncbi:MAG: potassium-transporting ATPase subunit C [Flavobacteriales bacterium]|nr:potassium-transporting ATPase subunit C [Flavobacteriales bacterium]
MKNELFKGIRITAVCAVIFALIYPVMIWAIAQFSEGNGMGQTITIQSRKHYLNVGQEFTQQGYFHGRPSAVNYNAAGAAGSNKGPSNPDYLKAVEERIQQLLQDNPDMKREDIPADLVTASGSGLDPHISLEAALFQIPRISSHTGIDSNKLHQWISDQVDMQTTGIPAVNVLQLNLEILKEMSHE